MAPISIAPSLWGDCRALRLLCRVFLPCGALVVHSWVVSSVVCARNDVYVWCVCGMVAGIVGWHLLVSSTANTSTTPQHLLVSSTPNTSTGISHVGRHRDELLPRSAPIYGLDADWDLWAEVSFLSLRLSLRLSSCLSPCLSPCLTPTISLPVYLSPPSLSLRVLLSLFGARSSLAMPLSRPPSLSPSLSLLTLPRGCAHFCVMSFGYQLMCVGLHLSLHITHLCIRTHTLTPTHTHTYTTDGHGRQTIFDVVRCNPVVPWHRYTRCRRFQGLHTQQELVSRRHYHTQHPLSHYHTQHPLLHHFQVAVLCLAEVECTRTITRTILLSLRSEERLKGLRPLSVLPTVEAVFDGSVLTAR